MIVFTFQALSETHLQIFDNVESFLHECVRDTT